MRLIIDLLVCEALPLENALASHAFSRARAIAQEAGTAEVFLAFTAKLGEAAETRIAPIRRSFDALIAPGRVVGCPPLRLEAGSKSGMVVPSSRRMRDEYLLALKPDVVYLPGFSACLVHGHATDVHPGFDLALDLDDRDLVREGPEDFRRRQFLKQARWLFTTSDRARHESARALRRPADRVVRLEPAPRAGFHPDDSGERSPGAPFVVLASGSVDRATCEVALEAFARLIWLPAVSDELLHELYSAASALIAASELEGFGLPLVEAAKHGLPIIARDIPVFREVAREHAFFFEGRDPASLAVALTNWLALAASGQEPPSRGMPIKTWAESARQLFDIVAHDVGSVS